MTGRLKSGLGEGLADIAAMVHDLADKAVIDRFLGAPTSEDIAYNILRKSRFSRYCH